MACVDCGREIVFWKRPGEFFKRVDESMTKRSGHWLAVNLAICRSGYLAAAGLDILPRALAAFQKTTPGV